MSPIVFLFLAFAPGILCARWAGWPPWLLYYLFFLSNLWAGICLVDSKGKRLACAFLHLSLFLLGWLLGVLHLYPLQSDSMCPWMYAMGQGELCVEGIVMTPSVTSQDAKGPSHRFLMRCFSMESSSGEIRKVRGSLRVTLRSKDPPLPGGVYRCRAWYPGPGFPRNPGAFDYASSLRWQGINGHVFARSSQNGFELLVPPKKISLARILGNMDVWMRLNLTRNLSEESRGLVVAMILGHKDELQLESRSSLQKAGLAHIMAVSGLHVMGLTFLLDWALRRCGFPGWLQDVFLLLFLAGYCGLVGFRAPVIRASLMASLLLMSRKVHRPSHGPSSLVVAGFILLLKNPLSLFSVSFQFSFAGVAGIFLLRPSMLCCIDRLLGPEDPKKRSMLIAWGRRLMDLFSMTLSVQLMTAPLAARFFQQISVTGSLSNLIVVPLVPFLMASALIKAFLGGIHPQLDLIPRICTEILAWIILTVARTAETWPWACLATPQPSWVQVGSLYGILVFGAVGWRRPWTVSLAVILLCSSLAWEWQQRQHSMEGVFLDVGQGDAAVLRLPGGEVVIVDTGPEGDDGRCEVRDYLGRQGVKRIKLLVLSHPDADHIGGFRGILEQVQVQEVLCSPYPAKSLLWQQSEFLMRKQELPRNRANAGQLLELGPNVKLEIWGPCLEASTLSSNDSSVVFCLEYQGILLLFTGDVESKGEELLARSGRLKEVDLLKVSHHGARNATQWPFLKRVRARQAIVSVGRGNPYRHPSPQVLLRLAHIGCSTYRTDEEGAFLFRIHRGNLKTRTMKQAWTSKNAPPTWWLRAWNIYPFPVQGSPP